MTADGVAGIEGADLAGAITDGIHRLRQRVYFEDTDFSGLVYHARYLHFMERGRSDFMRLLGVHHHRLAEEGLAFAVARMAIRFRAPARIDDVVTIETRPLARGGARIVLSQTILREAAILVEAEVTVALLGADRRARRLPSAIAAAFGTPDGD